MLKCIVFDLDGTLVDIGELFYRVFNTFLARLNLPAVTFEHKGDPWASAHDQTVSRYPQVAELVGRDAFADTWEDVLRAMLRAGEVRPYNGALETLSQLEAAGKTLCLASNTPKRFVDIKLSWFALSGFFEHVFTPQDRWGPKPRPQSLLYVLDRFQLSPEEVLVVGDHAQDVQYGKSAGVHTAAVLGGYGSVEELEAAEPDLLIQSVSQLAELDPGLRGA
jgi:HAD superfamily hydrolase (TIGR01509 family)